MGKKLSIVLALVCFLIVSINAFAVEKKVMQHHHKKSSYKAKAILLISFGTSIPQAQIAFSKIEKKVKDAFPGIAVRWAYTSHNIRYKIAREGLYTDSVQLALAKMVDEGFTDIVAQSFHIIPGHEYHDSQRDVLTFSKMSGGFKKVVMGSPLLTSSEDFTRVTDLMLKNIPKDRNKNDGVVFMGHGSHHPCGAFYEAMMYRLQKKDPNVFLGTVEGSIDIHEIKEMMLKKGIKKTYLIPFMSVAGDHAQNDMAGNEKDSWKSILTNAGIKCIPVMKGIAEYDNIIDVWTDHLHTAMNKLQHN